MTKEKELTIEVDPVTVLFFAVNAIRGWTESMETAIENKNAFALREAIDKLVEMSTSAQRAIKEGAFG